MNISKKFPEIVQDIPNVYEDAESQLMVSQQLQKGRSIGTLVTSSAAERDGAHVEWHGVYTAVAKKGDQRVLLRGHMCTDTATSGQIVRDKYLTKQILQSAGIATPRGRLATTPEEAVAIQRELGTAVVVKPRYGGQGKGVTVNVHSASDIREAFQSIDHSGESVLIEEYIDGIEFRLLATPNKCFGAVRRLLPSVEGNGVSSVSALIDKKNELRKKNPNNCRLLIPVDRTTVKHLERQGLTLASILPAGKSVIVRNVGGISSGGEASECLDLLDLSVKTLACNAMGSIPTMEWGGADILLSKDSGLPYVLELNTNAAISNSTFPVYGRPKDVGEAAWRHMLDRAMLDAERKVSVDTLPEPRLVKDVLPEGVRNNASNMRAILNNHLKKNSWSTKLRSGRLIRARQSGKPDKWFNGLMDERFPARVSSLLRSHHTVRSILRDANITVPRAAQVRGIEEIKDYQERSQTELVLVSRERGWAGREHYAADSRSSVVKTTSRMLAQQVSPGIHVRAFASRNRCMAILSGDPRFLPTPDQAKKISMIAIDAVRAIPGLPWAEVDVAIPEGPDGVMTVEGMSVQRHISGFTYLCAGSMESTMDMIAGLL